MTHDELHVVPVNDLREHETSAQCWCQPVEVFDGDAAVWCHNSMDRREYTVEKGVIQ